MSTHGQASAPAFQTNHALWADSPLPADNVAPLFDYELYRQTRSRDPSFKYEPTDAQPRAGDQGSLSLASMVNSYYESPHDHMGMHRYAVRNNAPVNGFPPSLQAAVAPPAHMTGGGFENPVLKAGQQSYAGGWNCASQQALPLPQRRSSQRQLEATPTGTVVEQRPHTPFLSVVISVAHIVILVMTMQQNDCPSHTAQGCLNPSLHRFAFQPFGENPLLGPSAKTLLRMGGLESDLVTKAREGWRVVSAMWLHAGVLHILSTSLGMFVLGMPLERQLGFLKVGAIYVASGFMGSVLSALMVQGRVSVGASGAVMGLLGATLAAVVVEWRAHGNRAGALGAVIVLAALYTVVGLMPFVDNFMHVGGALTGIVLANLLLIRPTSFQCWQSAAVYDQHDLPAKRTSALILDLVWLLSLAVLVAGAILGLYALFSGVDVTDGCSWCQYLTCVPSRFWKCSGNQHLGCNPSSLSGSLQITCANGQVLDYSSIQYVNKITPQIQGLCVKACV